MFLRVSLFFSFLIFNIFNAKFAALIGSLYFALLIISS
uniref:Uncharacterized protein n=1 Tax=Caudovirales sp. ct3EF15 TaxID=2826766 RepID=A0A8S5MM48_9CAUD|nr:MAG TPA: hypothetical protein [Caudovirales sp. ct3EF15]DAY45847.1 MAG TPA: hypothetical protein [Caudoviricetes sp.]